MAEYFQIKLPRDIEDEYILTDFHIGDAFHDHKAVARAVKYVNGHAPGVLRFLGDQGRWFGLKHRFAAVEEYEHSDYPTAAAQLARFEEIAVEIEHDPSLSFVHIGNHEQWLFKDAGNFYTADKAGPSFCDRVGLQYAGFAAFTTYKWPDGSMIRELATHGRKLNAYASKFTPGLRRRFEANAAIKLRDDLAGIDHGASDLYLCGHQHYAYKYEPAMVETLEQTNGDAEIGVHRECFLHKPVWAACCGSLCKSYPPGKTTYAEEKQLGFVDIAMVHVHFEKEGKNRIPEIEIVKLG